MAGPLFGGRLISPRTPSLHYPNALSSDDVYPGLSRRARWVPLDLLRGIAILLVIYGHINFRMPPNTVGVGLLYILRQMGLIGVDLFLVLSGFFTGLFFF